MHKLLLVSILGALLKIRRNQKQNTNGIESIYERKYYLVKKGNILKYRMVTRL